MRISAMIVAALMVLVSAIPASAKIEPIPVEETVVVTEGGQVYHVTGVVLTPINEGDTLSPEVVEMMGSRLIGFIYAYTEVDNQRRELRHWYTLGEEMVIGLAPDAMPLPEPGGKLKVEPEGVCFDLGQRAFFELSPPFTLLVDGVFFGAEHVAATPQERDSLIMALSAHAKAIAERKRNVERQRAALEAIGFHVTMQRVQPMGLIKDAEQK